MQLIIVEPSTPYTTNYYVDSVGGDDSDPGTFAQPFQNLSAVQALVGSIPAWTCIHLKCGSSWVGADAFLEIQQENMRIESYGAGALPVIDGRVVMTAGGWTLTPAKSHTYQYSVIGLNNGGEVHNIWEDGIRLIRAASLALVESTPGSYWIPAEGAFATGVPIDLYVNPTGNNNPATNGMVYTTQGVNWAVYLGAEDKLNAQVYNIEVMGGAHHNGNIQAGRTSYMEGVIARWGVIHSVYTDSGFFVDCTSYDCEQGYDFVANKGSQTDGFIEMNGCVSDIDETIAVVEGPGFFVHGSTIHTIRYINCISRMHIYGFAVNGIGEAGQTVYIDGCEATCDNAVLFNGYDINTLDNGGGLDNVTTITNCLSDGYGKFLYAYGLNTTTVVNIIGCRCVVRGANIAMQLRYGTVNISYSSFYGSADAGYAAGFATTDGATLTWNHNIVDGFGLGVESYNSVVYSGDNNVWHFGANGPQYVIAGAYSANYAAFVSNGYEVTGSKNDPLWNQDPDIAHDFTIQIGSPATALSAGYTFAP